VALTMKLIISLALTVIVLITPSTVAAQSIQGINNNYFGLDFWNTTSSFDLALVEYLVVPAADTLEIAKPEPIVYTVMPGDNLSKIGTANNVEWQRLWAKNTEIKHPDLIYIGAKLAIPGPSEQLERALPAVVALTKLTPGVAPLGSYNANNTYDRGYCTWYVKNRRGVSLPNTLGNANTWYSRAIANNMAVGTEPRVGAVATTTSGSLGHVAYVESVNGDGSITVSEMNYRGWNITSYRTVNASSFVYIY
jgi:surface antigen